MSLHAKELDALQNIYNCHRADSPLNMEIRIALRRHAWSDKLQFGQDSAGNVYITSLGRDPELAEIAIAFPLDTGALSSQSFASAFECFGILRQENLPCGITLMGYTSIQAPATGLELWESSKSIDGESAPSHIIPSIDQFSNLPHSAEFTLSAIFEVCDSTETPLSLTGSSLLSGKAQKFITDSAEIMTGTKEFRRAPHLRVEGPKAGDVVRRTVCAYADYVVALFDNFD